MGNKKHGAGRSGSALAVLLAVAVTLSGCAAGPMGGRERGTATGAVLGAGAGAIIGSTTGDAAEGALIGGALGAITGAVVGDRGEATDQRNAAARDQLDRQDAELARNRELIEKLKARNLSASSSARGVVVTLPDVLFRFGKADLTDSARSKTRDIADILTSDAAGRRVAIEGHTDSVGPSNYNQGLSDRRAATVLNALNTAGVSRKLLSARGFGEDRPIAPNTRSDGTDNPDGRARNRRVEVIILNSAAG